MVHKKTLFENIVSQAFSILNSYLDSSINEIQKRESLGIEQKSRKVEIENYFQLIYYLNSFVQEAFSILNNMDKNCFSEEEFIGLKKEWLIDCIIKRNICGKYSKPIIDHFMSYIPLCTDPIEYKWVFYNDCLQNKRIAYTLNKTSGKLIVKSYYIPEKISLEAFKSILDIKDEDYLLSLLENRLKEDTDNIC